MDFIKSMGDRFTLSRRLCRGIVLVMGTSFDRNPY